MFKVTTAAARRAIVDSTCRCTQRRSQKFVSEGDKTGELGIEVPQWGPGQSPSGGLGAKPQEAEDMHITLITIALQ